MTLKILGTGSGLPEKIVTNDDLAQIMDTSDEWISSRTGIKKRHISVTETTTDLSVTAAKNALAMAGVAAEEIDLIIVGTISPEYFYPSCACQVQAALGASNAVAFDVSAACSGFLFGLNTAYAYFQAGVFKKALIIGAENLSKMMDWNDRSTCVLFGDGAGAAVVEAVEDTTDGGVLSITMGSDGASGMNLICKNRPINNPFSPCEEPLSYTSMNGQEVYKFAVRTVPKAINEVLEKAGKTPEDVDVYLLHQANMRIIESVAKRVGQPLEKFPMNLMDYANTSAASVPLLLDYANRKGMLKKGDTILLAGFGGGLTWGAALLTW